MAWGKWMHESAVWRLMSRYFARRESGSGSCAPHVCASALPTRRRIHAVDTFSVAGCTGMIMPAAPPTPSPTTSMNGVGHALEPIVELQLARHGYAHARLEGVHEPRLAERRHHQHARLVHQADLDESELGPRALELDVVDGRLRWCTARRCGPTPPSPWRKGRCSGAGSARPGRAPYGCPRPRARGRAPGSPGARA